MTSKDKKLVFGYQNPIAHIHFNMFVDEWMSANESPATT